MKPYVLIAEDEKAVSELLLYNLRKEDYDVGVAGDGEETLIMIDERAPDLLLLDEPTNHLDLDSLLWLENFLKNTPSALLLISHDREFLDNIVDHIAHIEQQQVDAVFLQIIDGLLASRDDRPRGGVRDRGGAAPRAIRGKPLRRTVPSAP